MRTAGKRRRHAQVPLQRILDDAALHGTVPDSGQLAVMRELCEGPALPAYLWGSVGRGKSWIMDGYFDRLPRERRRRRHFHAFLADIHTALTTRAGDSGGALAGLTDGLEVLLLDEFHLHDVADAHLMNRWLPGALNRGVRVLATSNYPPEGLLPDPLFHDAAAPVIATLRERFLVLRIPDGRDYRTEPPPGVPSLPGWTPPNPEPGPLALSRVPLGGGSRTFTARDHGGALVTDFGELCEVPLSVQDHLALARTYSRWAIRDVPSLHLVHRESLQRFARLVDVLCDERVDVRFESLFEAPRGSELADRLRDSERLTSRLALLSRRPFASQLPATIH